jgi:hypothetical protein
MNFRSTYILFGLVLAAMLGLAIYVLFSDGSNSSKTNEGYLLKKFLTANGMPSPKPVTTLEIRSPNDAKPIVIVRDGANWKLTSPITGRADSQVVERALSSLLLAKTVKGIDVSGNPAEHGVNENSVRITLKSEDHTESLNLGDVSIGGDKAVAYLTTSEKPNEIQAIRRSDLEPLFKEDLPKGTTPTPQLIKSLADFRPLQLLGVGIQEPLVQIKSFRMIDDGSEIALFKGPNNSWQFRLPADYGEADPEGTGPMPNAKDGKTTINSVRQLLNEAMNIRPGNSKQLIESPTDLAKYGLDPAKNKPMQIMFTRDDGTNETLYVGDMVKTDNTDRYYARTEGDSVVAEVNATAVRNIKNAIKQKQNFRNRTVVALNPTRIDALDIDTNGEKFELRRDPTGWKAFDSTGYELPAKVSAVGTLINKLLAKPLATGFPEAQLPDDRKGFTKPTAEIKIWEGGILPPEKKDEKKKDDKPVSTKPKVSPTPSIRLIFGNKDAGDVVYVRRIVGDTKTDFFVPLEAFTLASRPRLDYIEGSLKPFGVDSVLKLSYTQGKDVYTVERPDDKAIARQAAWKFTSPESMKGRVVDADRVLSLLSQLTAINVQRVVADRPKEDLLNRLEVSPTAARQKVVLKLKDQPDLTLFFGGDAGPNKQFIYLKANDSNMVYEADRSAFEALQKVDLQSTIIHRLEKPKIDRLVLKGWQGTIGELKSIELVRQDGKWTLKMGGSFELDPAKVDAFLNELTEPKAERFVVQKTGPLPEHQLEFAKNALEIEMDVQGGQKIKMMISPAKEGKVYATSSTMPGDVFVLPDRFAAIRDKPTAFRKD